MREPIAHFKLQQERGVRQIDAAGNVIQFDRSNGINRVALDLFTPASNTNFPSTSLSFQLCPYTLSKSDPPSKFFISYSVFPPLILLSFCPLQPLLRSFLLVYPLPSPAQSKSPITRALLLPLLTNAGVRQVCHKQVGGTGRERKRAHRTTQVTANARPPTQEDTRHKVQTPVSSEDPQTDACKIDTNTHKVHICTYSFTAAQVRHMAQG